MAAAKISGQPALGRAVGAGRRGCLVWSDDRAAWLDVCRSIYHSTSFCALCDEQVSPSRAVLFLFSSAGGARPAVDRAASGGVQLRARVELARRRAARSFARVYARLDCHAAGLLFVFRIEADPLRSARDAGRPAAGGRASDVLPARRTRRQGNEIDGRALDRAGVGWRLVFHSLSTPK